MRIVRFKKGNDTYYGILEGAFINELKRDVFTPIEKKSHQNFITGSARYELTGRKYPMEELKILAPCQPTKIVALGLNYRSHAEELKMKLPEDPLLFLKPSTAVIGPNEDIIYPAMSHRVDYEAELGVVIGRET